MRRSISAIVMALLLMVVLTPNALGDPTLYTCEDVGEPGQCTGTPQCLGDELVDAGPCKAECYKRGEWQGTLHCPYAN